MTTPEISGAKARKFATVQREAIAVSKQELIRTACLQPGQTLPLVVEPNLDAVNISSWARNNREFLVNNLDKYGGILFRGFDWRHRTISRTL